MSTNLVFVGEFLAKSIAKLSLPVRSYSKISHIILMIKNTIYDFFVNNKKQEQNANLGEDIHSAYHQI
jgi:hypothetical protein